MSILIKPYEISVWQRKWNGTSSCFEEELVGVIGTDLMTNQNRALNPTLVRSSDGQRTLSFSMYSRYKDDLTGEEVFNPFVQWLSNDKKIKLKYGKTINADGVEIDNWYDFVITNIEENSADCLYTYTLEDAHVMELSKNGYGIILDAQLRDENGISNTGTITQLANKVLQETGWKVESEVFVQKIEESLVYISIPAGVTVTRILDYNDTEEGLKTESYQFLSDQLGLAFYSSTREKPHRFQFIYLNDYSKDVVQIGEDRIITTPSCQYYLDMDLISNYVDHGNGFYLPPNFGLVNPTGAGYSDAQISIWYRGARYGFTQKSEYISQLDRYCSKYTKNDIPYYGYLNVSYASPITVQNVINNPEFQDKKGWFGGYSGTTELAYDTYAVVPTGTYGRFVTNADGAVEFVSLMDDLVSGRYSTEHQYKAYLKVDVPSSGETNTPILINTGFYDHRQEIKQTSYNEEWKLSLRWFSESGVPIYDVSQIYAPYLREISYAQDSGTYELGDIWAQEKIGVDDTLLFNSESQKTGGFADVGVSSSTFTTKQIKLVLQFKPQTTAKTYYLESAELYKLVPYGDSYLVPGRLSQEEIILHEYCFFPCDEVADSLNLDNVEEFDIPLEKSYEIDYSVYKPSYNATGEKVRTVSVKESNYFNILQSLAEAFEAWMVLDIEHDPNTGEILSKTVKFKNYIGKDNYAAIQYGINLQSMVRTQESKELVTKLIIRDNNNTHAIDEKASISRASSNPTGENYIYNFSHFIDTGELESDAYDSIVWGQTNESTGPDLGVGHEEEDYNLVGYFPRIKNINTSLVDLNEEIGAIQSSLVVINGQKASEESIYATSVDGLEKVRREFLEETGFTPETILSSEIQSVQCVIPAADDATYGIETLNKDKKWAKDAQITATQLSLGRYKFIANLPSTQTKNVTIGLLPNPSSSTVSWNGGTSELNVTKLRKVTSETGEVYENITDNAKAGLEVLATYEVGSQYVLTFNIAFVGNTGQTGENISCCFDLFNANGASIELFDPVNTANMVKSSNTGILEYKFQNNTTYPIKCVANCTRRAGEDFNLQGLTIIPNTGIYKDFKCRITNIALTETKASLSTSKRSLYFAPKFTIKLNDDEALNNFTEFQPILSCPIEANSHTGVLEYTVSLVDTTNSSVSSRLSEYADYKRRIDGALKKLDGYDGEIGLRSAASEKTALINEKQAKIAALTHHKKELNSLFYQTYSHFIREGTWIDETYVDDNEYYIDAVTASQDSCRPRVSYNINLISLTGLPGYEDYSYEPGDKTYVIDPEFFGADYSEEVIVTNIAEHLSDPSQNSINVQNFKKNFQDLFQKITATVQQVQYHQGSYEKTVAFLDSSSSRKNSFITDALNSANSVLTQAGQTSVKQDVNGITLTDSLTKDELRLIGGGILLSTEDEDGNRQWRTGLTADGISASLLTAGTLDVGEITIRNARDPIFRWDAYGLSAFDVNWNENGIGVPNLKKFVRFDKYGIYGIDATEVLGLQGDSWRPQSLDDVVDNAAYSLTWEGLRIISNNGKEGSERIKARTLIGKNSDKIISIVQRHVGQEREVFSVDCEGKGIIGGWTLSPSTGYNGGLYHDCKYEQPVIQEDGTEVKIPHHYRIGLKTEDGDTERYAFYVRKFKSHQAEGEAPAGEIIFGVKHDGSIKATAGKIAGWMIEPDRLGKHDTAIYAGDALQYPSVVWPGKTSPPRFYSGNDGGGTYTTDLTFVNGRVTFALDSETRSKFKITNYTTKVPIKETDSLGKTISCNFIVDQSGRRAYGSAYFFKNSRTDVVVQTDFKVVTHAEDWAAGQGYLDDNGYYNFEVDLLWGVWTPGTEFNLDILCTIHRILEMDVEFQQLNDYTLQASYPYLNTYMTISNYSYHIDRITPRFCVLDDGTIYAEAGTFGPLSIGTFEGTNVDGGKEAYEMSIFVKRFEGYETDKTTPIYKTGYYYIGSSGLLFPQYWHKNFDARYGTHINESTVSIIKEDDRSNIYFSRLSAGELQVVINAVGAKVDPEGLYLYTGDDVQQYGFIRSGRGGYQLTAGGAGSVSLEHLVRMGKLMANLPSSQTVTVVTGRDGVNLATRTLTFQYGLFVS